jgi:transcription elongation factor GreA
MYDELTKVDIEKMEAELKHRITELRPELIRDVQTAREFGDLSENDEYKVAKREKNRNESRIRYLERMIKTARVVEAGSGEGIGLFDRVTLSLPEDDETEHIQLVTSMRQDALQGRITRNSPMGKAIWGRRAGDRVTVTVNESYSYEAQIVAVEPGEDDESLPILPY